MIGCVDVIKVLEWFLAISFLPFVIFSRYRRNVRFSVPVLATDAPLSSSLAPSWVGFTPEETEFLKGNILPA